METLKGITYFVVFVFIIVPILYTIHSLLSWIYGS